MNNMFRNVQNRHDRLGEIVGPLWQRIAASARFLPDQLADGGDIDGEDTTGTADTPASSTATTASTATAAATATTDTTGSLLEFAGLVNSDGSFIDGWYESDLLPEEIRGNKSLANIKDLAGL